MGEDGIQSVPERAPVYLNNAATSFTKPSDMAEEVARLGRQRRALF